MAWGGVAWFAALGVLWAGNAWDWIVSTQWFKRWRGRRRNAQNFDFYNDPARREPERGYDQSGRKKLEPGIIGDDEDEVKAYFEQDPYTQLGWDELPDWQRESWRRAYRDEHEAQQRVVQLLAHEWIEEEWADEPDPGIPVEMVGAQRDDPRWQATLEYTVDDDGVWLNLGDQRVSLGFFPTVSDVLRAAAKLLKPTQKGG